MNKKIILSLAAGAGLLSGAFYLAQNSDTKNPPHHLTTKERLEGKELSLDQAGALLGHIHSSLDQNHFAQCSADEDGYLIIEKEVLNPLTKALINKDFAKAQQLLKKNHFNIDFWGQPHHSGDFKLHSWESTAKEYSLSQLFEHAQTIEDLTFETLLVAISPESRSSQSKFSEALLKTELNFRGVDQEGKRYQASGHLRLRVMKENKQWLISDIETLKGDSVIGLRERPAFAKVQASAIFDRAPVSYVRSEAIRRGGYALAVNDGDLYIGAAGESTLYRRNAEGKFQQQANAPIDSMVKAAAFADFNNDGIQDLLVVRFIDKENERGLRGDTAVMVYYGKADGTFDLDPVAIKETQRNVDRPMPAAIADFDGDGHLDIYIGYPGALDFTSHGEKNESLTSHGLYFGSASGQFIPLAAENFRYSFLDHNIGYPHSALATDYDMDGKMDLIVVDDRAGLSTAFKNKGQRNFAQEATTIGIGNNGYGMAITSGDINGDGIIDLIMTNVETVAAQRIEDSCRVNWDLQWDLQKERGLRVFLGRGATGFQEVAPELLGLDSAGYGLSGVRLLDYNNDGTLDLYVTNGLWSGTQREQKLDSYFVRSYQALNQKGLQAIVQRSLSDYTQSIYMDVLSFFKGDVNTGSFYEDGARPSLAGHQRNRLFKNLGGRFIDVAYIEGVDSLADGYVVAAADLNNKDRLDLILRNGDPGSIDVSFEPVEIFQNQLNQGNALQLHLIGSESNKDAIGAKVFVTSKNKTQFQELIGLEGTVQSSKILHFGLGQAQLADHVRIIWPSGQESELKQLPRGRHKIQEPRKELGQEHEPSDKSPKMSLNY